MNRTAEAALAGPVSVSAGIPLRVAVYHRITAAIQSGALPRSSLLPSESQLGDAMGVSRTVVREALMLVEEDGFVRSQRGIGRFVEDHPPTFGIERLRPLEDMLAAPDRPTRARRLQTERTRTSLGFASDGLGISPQDASWFVETIITAGDRPIALLQEHLPIDPGMERFGALIEHTVSADPDLGRSVLAAMGPLVGTRGRTEISAGVPGAARGRLLDLAPDAPVLLLTQRLDVEGTAFYLSKALINPEFAQLEVRHTA